MKNKEYLDELNLLSDQLSSEEIFILSYLKGFDRKIIKKWQEKGLI